MGRGWCLDWRHQGRVCSRPEIYCLGFSEFQEINPAEFLLFAGPLCRAPKPAVTGYCSRPAGPSVSCDGKPWSACARTWLSGEDRKLIYISSVNEISEAHVR